MSGTLGESSCFCSVPGRQRLEPSLTEPYGEVRSPPWSSGRETVPNRPYLRAIRISQQFLTNGAHNLVPADPFEGFDQSRSIGLAGRAKVVHHFTIGVVSKTSHRESARHRV